MATKAEMEKMQREQIAMNLEDTYGAEPLNDALEKLYSEMNIAEGVAEVYVYKIVPDTGAEARIWKGFPDDYDLDNLAKRFGTGEYRVKVYVKQDSGRFAIKGNKTFHMLLDPVEEAAAKLKQNPQPATQSQINADQMAIMIANAVSAAMPKQPQIDPMAQLSTLAGIFKQMAPNTPTPQSALNPLDIIKLVMEVRAMDKDDKNDPIDKGTNASSMDVILRLVDKFAPMFAQTLATSAGQQTLAALPATSQPQQIQDQPTQTDEGAEAMNKLKAGLSFLVMQAKAGNDPGTYAGVTIDNVPADALKQIIENPQWIEYLSQFEPEIKNHATWFEEFRLAIIEELKTPDDIPSIQNP